MLLRSILRKNLITSCITTVITKITISNLASSLHKISICLCNFCPSDYGSEKIIKIFCIYYLIRIHKNKIQTLFNYKSKVYAIGSNYTDKLQLKI